MEPIKGEKSISPPNLKNSLVNTVQSAQKLHSKFLLKKEKTSIITSEDFQTLIKSFCALLLDFI